MDVPHVCNNAGKVRYSGGSAVRSPHCFQYAALLEAVCGGSAHRGCTPKVRDYMGRAKAVMLFLDKGRWSSCATKVLLEHLCRWGWIVSSVVFVYFHDIIESIAAFA